MLGRGDEACCLLGSRALKVEESAFAAHSGRVRGLHCGPTFSFVFRGRFDLFASSPLHLFSRQTHSTRQRRRETTKQSEINFPFSFHKWYRKPLQLSLSVSSFRPIRSHHTMWTGECRRAAPGSRWTPAERNLTLNTAAKDKTPLFLISGLKDAPLLQDLFLNITNPLSHLNTPYPSLSPPTPPP